MSQQKKSNYATVGSLIWQSEFTQEGKRKEGVYKLDAKQRKQYAITLDKNTEIIINGVNMTGKTLYVNRMDEVNDGKLQRGIIDQEEYDRKIEEFGQGGRLEFIQMEIKAKLD
jgi:hypothetical protein